MQIASTRYQAAWPTREMILGGSIALATLGTFWSPITASALLIFLGLIGGFFQINSVFLAAVFFLPLNLTVRSDLAISDISSCFRIALLMGTIAGELVAGRPVLRSQWKVPLNRYILAYVVIVIISIGLERPISPSSAKAFFHLISYIAFYLSMVEWLISEDRILMTLKVFMWSSLMVALFGVIQSISGGYTQFYFVLFPNQSRDLVFWDGRITSFLNYSNSLAGYLALAISITLAVRVMSTRGGSQLLSSVALVGDFVALLLTESRGGMAAVAGSFAVALVLLGRKTQKVLFLLSIVGIAVLLFTWSDRQQYQTLGYDTSLVTRAVIFLSAWQMFRQSPILGIGYGNFKELFDSSILHVDQGTFDVHNLYLQHLAEVGVVGFCAFFAILIVAAREAYVLFKRSSYETARCVGFFFLAALAAILIHGVVDFLFNVSPPVGSLFWFLFAFLIAAQKLSARTAL